MVSVPVEIGALPSSTYYVRFENNDDAMCVSSDDLRNGIAKHVQGGGAPSTFHSGLHTVSIKTLAIGRFEATVSRVVT